MKDESAKTARLDQDGAVQVCLSLSVAAALETGHTAVPA